MEETERAPLVFTRGRLIEWSECDPAGIVYYPHYLEMFDANTNALFQHVTGMDKRAIQEAHGILGWPMVDCRASFLSPATYGDMVTVASHVVRFGRSSIALAHRITHADGRPVAEGQDTRVWTGRDPDRPGGIRAVPLPKAFTAPFFA